MTALALALLLVGAPRTMATAHAVCSEPGITSRAAFLRLGEPLADKEMTCSASKDPWPCRVWSYRYGDGQREDEILVFFSRDDGGAWRLNHCLRCKGTSKDCATFPFTGE